MGGYKGVLMSAKFYDGDIKIYTRKSMRKFDLAAGQKKVELEVIRLATFSQGYLNKQIILVLWSNGVNISVFLQLQSAYISKLRGYFNLENLGIEYEFPSEIFQSFRFIQWKLSIMHKKGMDYYADPFIMPIIKII